MDSCNHCGHKLNPGQKFCNSCGAPVNNLSSAPSQDPPSQSRARQTGGNGPVSAKSRKTILAIGIAAIVLVILFIAYQVVQSALKPEKVEAKFEDAVKTQNAKEMAGILSSSSGLAINEDSVHDFIAYFKNHPDVYSDTVTNLKKDTALVKAGDYYSSKNPVRIISGGKKWLIFHTYVVDSQAYFIDVNTNQKETDVTINGQTVGKINKKKTFGPYLLSDFKIKGTYKGKYAGVHDSESIDPLDFGNSKRLSANLNLTGNMISIYSDEADAILFVNGKSTGKKIADIESFGPVPVDGSMKLQAVLSDGKKSNEEKVTEPDQEVDLYFDSSSSDFSFSQPADNSSTGAMGDAAAAVRNHYNDITNGNYAGAYNLMSSARRAKYSLDGWTKGFSNNIRDEVTIDSEQFPSSTTAIVSFTLTSYDKQSDGTTLVQKFGGSWNLVNENGQWLLDSPSIKKVDSYTE